MEVLDTGAGKTMIAVMLIRQIAHSTKSTHQKKLIVFLAPTVHLVNQQFGVIKSYTNLAVEEYHGAKGIDDWNLNGWEKGIEVQDVMVMTPQILLDGLRKEFFKMETVSLLVIDECYRASGNHPCVKIMKEFYHTSSDKPKIFGMTASPVIGKVISSTTDCKGQISTLEIILNSQIYTIKDRTELEICVPSASETCRFYDQAQFPFQGLKLMMETLWSGFDASLLRLQRSRENQYKDVGDRLERMRKRFSKDYSKILYCLEDLGLVCAYEAAKFCQENSSDPQEDSKLYNESHLKHTQFLNELLQLLGVFSLTGINNFGDFSDDLVKAVDLGYISPKLHELINIFKSFGESNEVLCLVFVERIITAKVLDRLVKKIKFLSHFTVSHITGSNSSCDSVVPKMQNEILQLFSCGKVNLLFATDFVEEGIQVANCSCVIRFDLPKTVRSYVQSRGRARQNNSQFVIMIERENVKQRNQLFDIIRSEYSMADVTMKRDDSSALVPYRTEEIHTYCVNTTGACVTADSSVSLIHRYCEKLPGDKYFVPKPIFQLSYSEGNYQCKLSLPPNAPFQTLIGPASSNSQLSKQLVCLEACKKLHQIGALNDHLLPFSEEPLDSNTCFNWKKSPAGEGTTKLKELHGTACIRALSGTWIANPNGANFHAYKFDFTCDIIEEIYSGFVLLMESKLDDDVGNCEADLYLISKTVKSRVSAWGNVYLDAEQMFKAKGFQELFFNGLFGRLFVGSEESGVKRVFLLQHQTSKLWSPSKMYLLLPLETLNSEGEALRINWRGVNSCIEVIQYFQSRALSYVLSSELCHKQNLSNRNGSSDMEQKSSMTAHLANCVVDIDGLKDMVVLAIHTGRFYSVVEVVTNTSAECPFSYNGSDVSVSSEYSTYIEYYRKRYGIMLMYPGQPLLRLKQSHNPHNLLVNFRSEGVSSVSEKEQVHVYMPPEVLVKTDVPVQVLKSFYLLPSLMHRLESLMLASQLRKEINFNSGSFQIPSSLILEALTTLKCCEIFSMERLELLGDSVLKYAVSCHLYLRYPEKHEGQLSDWRSSLISNSALHKLGTNCNLQGYIRDSAFEPRRWAAPGQISIHGVPCRCGVDTSEVPLDEKFQTKNPTCKVGKLCDRGHRWICSKTISDCVEALIGAYYVGNGLVAALHTMKWLGIGLELDPSLVEEAINKASLRCYVPKANEITALESKLGYEFSCKGFLREAITHASEQELGVGYCYQRPEFLGDSVLGLLLTWHLHKTYQDIDPGRLTDLRSNAISNENFALVCIRRNLQPHLLHCSGFLQSQVTEFVRSLTEPLNNSSLHEKIKAPKALGDMVESIAGAILIDTNLDLEKVWRIFEPLLSPIVTPDSLKLPSLRKLNEMCDSLGYFIKERCIKVGEMVHSELRLQMEDVLLIGRGCERNKKAAKAAAASCLLEELEKKKDVSNRNGISKWTKKDSDSDDAFPTSSLNMKTCSQVTNEESCRKEKQKVTESQCPERSAKASFPINGCPGKTCSISPATLVIGPINMSKGGPRTSIFGICKTLQWPMPTFRTKETKSRTPIEFREGSDKRYGFNSYVSKIMLQIPSSGIMECTGNPKADKKTSFDSAALTMLYELQQRGRISIISVPTEALHHNKLLLDDKANKSMYPMLIDQTSKHVK
ncbi:endoribonuclease Dicer homolog 3b-like [Prosopis cineraria]|uniref:endoribonuclease Dicer homolog 3b-like n=1 Tax=Prosopis cineraria TaxID=364024 RepID=UPI00240EF020|nr:endoribonuclease Dicer homolog 3b-like [Prosopis cineraria]